MRTIPDFGRFVGAACTLCGRKVERRQLALVVVVGQPQPFHPGCIDERDERIMSRLLGGR